MVFGLYTRVNQDDSEDDGGSRRASTTGSAPGATGAVVTSTGSQLGTSQPRQRKGGPGASSGNASIGNLIDLGDTDEPVASIKPHDKKRKPPAQQSVELVALPSADPFDFLVQQRAELSPPRAYSQLPAHHQASDMPFLHPLQSGGGLQQGVEGPTSSMRSSRPAEAYGGPASIAMLPTLMDTGALPIMAQQMPLKSSQVRYSHSASDISDLLQQHQADHAAAGAHGHAYQAPAIPHTDRRGNLINAGAPGLWDDLLSFAPAASTLGRAGRQEHSGTGLPRSSNTGQEPQQAVSAPSSLPPSGRGSDANTPCDTDPEAVGHTTNQRQLNLYAVPLVKDKLVFLPVANWMEQTDTSTVVGKVHAGVASVQQNISSMWHSLKEKDPGSLPHKIYKAGQAIFENMNAEERLMRNIPKKASKLVIHHPASIPPDEVQDQLTALTSSFCVKSAGKAAVAGVMLPVAVGLEVLFVPGIGWYTAYQLFKSTSAAAGGSRLNSYLKSDKSEVRICYVGNPKMDIYILKARLSPDGILGTEDIEDLVHDLQEPSLVHPLTELRMRQLKKTQTMNADYALLPMNAPDPEEAHGVATKKQS